MVHHLFALLLRHLHLSGSPLQPGRLLCSRQVIPADTEPVAVLLPDLPRGAGCHRFHGSADHRLHRALLPYHKLHLAVRGPKLPLLQLHGHVDGLLRIVPAAARRRHGCRAFHRHQPSVHALHQSPQESDRFHVAVGVVDRRLCSSAASGGRRQLPHPISWLLVLLLHWLPGERPSLFPHLLPVWATVYRYVVSAEHSECRDADKDVLQPGQDAAAPRSRGGDDGSAHTHKYRRFYLLVSLTSKLYQS